MASPQDAYIQLIKNLSINSIDDTDPNNIVIQQFQTPNENNQLGETVTITNNNVPYIYSGTKSVATFARTSLATLDDSSTWVGNGQPLFSPLNAPFSGSKSLLLETVTATQYVQNTDFMMYSGTGSLFKDNKYPGAAWTNVAGSWSWNSTTATSNANGSTIQIGKAWTPSTTNPLYFQGTFTTPSSVSWNNAFTVRFMYSSSIYIEVQTNYWGTDVNWWNNGSNDASTLYGWTPAANTTYTITMSYDGDHLTTNIYLGTGTGGANQFSDNSYNHTNVTSNPYRLGVTGNGFYVQVCCDSGMVMANPPTITGPIPTSWSTNTYSASYDWGVLPGQGINGLNAMTLFFDGYASGGWMVFQSNNLGTTDGVTYTWSIWAKADSNCTLAIRIANTSGQYVTAATTVNLTTSWQLFTGTGSIPSGGSASGELLYMIPPLGVRIYLSAAQVENNSVASMHIRNDGSSTFTRQWDNFNIPTTALSLAEGSIEFRVRPLQLVNYNNFFSMTGLSTGRFLIWFDTTGTVFWDYGPINSGVKSSANAVSTTKWTHIAVTWSASGNIRCLYINGALVSSTTFTAPASLPSTVYPVSNYGAYIADIRSSNKARTASEVSTAYNSGTYSLPDQYTLLKINGNGDILDYSSTYQSYLWNGGGTYMCGAINITGWQNATNVNTTTYYGTVYKTAATSAWDAGVVSTWSIPGNGNVTVQAGDTTAQKVFGLTGQTSVTSYTQIDACMYLQASGNLVIYEMGVQKLSGLTYTTSDTLKVSIESGVIKYYKNNTILYTSSMVPMYSRYYCGMAFYNPSGKFNNISMLQTNRGS